MSLGLILVFAAGTILLRVVFARQGRKWALLVASIFFIYAMQPESTIRGLDFWLPTATILTIIFSWVITSSTEERGLKQILPLVGVSCGVILVIAATRWFSVTGIITPSRPPAMEWVALVLGIAAIMIFLTMKFTKPARFNFVVLWVIVLSAFVALKLPGLNKLISNGLSGGGQASAGAIQWLGFSYIAFRVLHTIRDRQMGRLKDLALIDYFDYCIFYPVVPAGPIDRVERFTVDLNANQAITGEDFAEGGKKLVLGLFKKFFIADSLSMIALNTVNSSQIRTAGWSWVLLYAYAFQILFDFSGYTDIAIGLGRWLGFRLPENFNHPYTKQNLTLFWNSWHMSLSQWFRAYFFNPVTRKLRSVGKNLSPWYIVLIGQTGTMILIGLWHGITINFFIWGVWHALGLFLHNRWAEWMKPREVWFDAHKTAGVCRKILGIAITFNYVALGWVWFVLPDPAAAIRMFLRLFGADV